MVVLSGIVKVYSMEDRTRKASLEREKAFSRPRPLRDILIVAAPIVGLGAIGNVIGLSTLTGGAIINLGYIVAIVFGGVILRSQGSGWREVGLGKPASWWKSALSGVGAFVGAVVVFVAMQVIAVGLLTALEMAPSEIDQSRFNPIEGNLPLLILMLILAWTTIAFGEELFYRAFLITRLTDYTEIGPAVAIALSGIVFGAVRGRWVSSVMELLACSLPGSMCTAGVICGSPLLDTG